MRIAGRRFVQTARMPLPTPILHTARLRLRPFTATDVDTMFELQSNSRVPRYWDSPPWRERVQAERFIATCERLAEEASGAWLAIERIDSAVFIGWCSLFKLHRDYRSAGIGYCLNEASWG
jgi:[ribosomal protein S5]-alanine N-acetyltransferase